MRETTRIDGIYPGIYRIWQTPAFSDKGIIFIPVSARSSHAVNLDLVSCRCVPFEKQNRSLLILFEKTRSRYSGFGQYACKHLVTAESHEWVGREVISICKFNWSSTHAFYLAFHCFFSVPACTSWAKRHICPPNSQQPSLFTIYLFSYNLKIEFYANVLLVCLSTFRM